MNNQKTIEGIGIPSPPNPLDAVSNPMDMLKSLNPLNLFEKLFGDIFGKYIEQAKYLSLSLSLCCCCMVMLYFMMMFLR